MIKPLGYHVAHGGDHESVERPPGREGDPPRLAALVTESAREAIPRGPAE